MSSTIQYLLIDSTYRNRLQYPNPADFVIPFQSIHGANLNINVFNAQNPVSNAYPDLNIQFYTSNQGWGVVEGGTASAPVVSSEINIILGLQCFYPNQSNYTTLTQATDLFKGLFFGYEDQSIDEYILITGYSPAFRMFFLESPLLEFNVQSKRRYLVYNPSTPSTIILPGNLENAPILFPENPLYIYDLKLNELRRSTSFSIPSQTVYLEKPFGPEWKNTDPYIVCSRNPPLMTGICVHFPNTSSFFLESCCQQLRILNGGTTYQCGEIVRLKSPANDPLYDALFEVLSISHDCGALTTFRMIYPGEHFPLYFEGPLISTERTIMHPARAQVTNVGTAFMMEMSQENYSVNEWTGQFFFPLLLSNAFIQSSPPCNTDSEPIYGQYNYSIPLPFPLRQKIDWNQYRGQAYNGVMAILTSIPVSLTRTIIITQSFPHELLQKFRLLPPIPPVGATSCFILPFQGDGVVPLNFTGTSITQSQMTCYEISVVTLILPNQILDFYDGALTSAYPYVLLEITNESSPNGHNVAVLYSNNPAANRATFVCSISDINNPLITKFTKISSDGATQTLKFSPFDNLRMRITMPNGQVFRTEKTDLVPCVQPDPLLQIHLVLSIQRL